MALRVMDTTNELAKDFVGFKLGKTSTADVSMIARTLRRVAADVESNHGDLFQNMIRTIACGSGDISQSYSDIVKNMFSDSVINWGRIAVLFTFSGQVAIHCDKQGSPEDADRVISLLTDFVNTRLSNWIEKAGGWDSFNEHFKERKGDNGSVWWGDVLCTAGLLGAAGAALVFAR